jgi:hypothetical protein
MGTLNLSILDVGQQFPGTDADYLEIPSIVLQLTKSTGGVLIYFNAYLEELTAGVQSYLIHSDPVILFFFLKSSILT